MTPTQTSLLAWQSTRKTISARQQEVLDALKALGGSGTMHDVAWKLLKPLHAVSGRFSELERKGHIRKCGVKVSPGNSVRSIYWLEIRSGSAKEGLARPIPDRSGPERGRI